MSEHPVFVIVVLWVRYKIVQYRWPIAALAICAMIAYFVFKTGV